MRTLTIILGVLICSYSYSQRIEFISEIPGIATDKLAKGIDANDKVSFIGINSGPNVAGYTILTGIIRNANSDIEENISLKKIEKNVELEDPLTLSDFYILQSVYAGVYENLTKNGFQYDLRNDLEEETLELITSLEGSNRFFRDDFIEDYLYQLLHKIHPGYIKDLKPGRLNISIIKGPSPNAFTAPNGTILLTTGLFATIDCEAELLSILAHEVSHFVLDHAIINYNEAQQRQQRAEFWAGVATALAAATDVYLASQYDGYYYGGLTLGTAFLSYSIANSIVDRLGLKYSQEQEEQADDFATGIMNYIKSDPKALASALGKIKNHLIVNGDFYALTGNGSHPHIDSRIEKIGEFDTNQYYSENFFKTISPLNYFNALTEFQMTHFDVAENLVDRNINAGIGTEDDLVLKSILCRYQYNDDQHNNEALKHIEVAKSLNVVRPINLYKHEALTLLRLGRNQEAVEAFTLYNEVLNESLTELENQSSRESVINEIKWTKKMIYKTPKLYKN
ncbi:M48 family metalloprotease [Bacteroidota bacterium]